MKEGLRFLEAIIDNFKSIDHRVINFEGGKSIIITGKNDKGKTSLIQALLSPVDSKFIPSKAIKTGEDTGSIQLKIGGTINGLEEVYSLDIYFSQEHQNGRIVLHDKEGAAIKKNVASMLDSIIGEIGFDVFHFLNLGKTNTGKVSKSGVKEQIDFLLKIIPEESRTAIFAVDEKKGITTEKRKANNSLLSILEAEYKGCPYTPEQIAEFVEADDEKELALKEAAEKDLQTISDKIVTWNKVNDGTTLRKQEKEKIISLDTKELEAMKALLENLASQKWESYLGGKYQEQMISLANSMQEDITINRNLLAEQQRLSLEIEKGDKWLSSNPKPSVESANAKLKAVTDRIDLIKSIKEYGAKHTRIQELKATIKKQDDELKAIEKERKDIFAGAQMPVPGLSFTEDEIYYKDLPFNEDSQSKSVLIGVGIKIGMALNPRLKVLVIKDGSLLDNDTLKMIVKMADKYGYQLLIEMVDNTNLSPEIKFTEDVIK